MYLDPERILDRFPGAFPQKLADMNEGATDEQLAALWLAKVEAEIAHYSRYIDDAVGGMYPRRGTYKFPAWDGTPPTPAVIGEICMYLSMFGLWSTYFEPVQTGTETAEERSFRGLAEDLLTKIRKGEISVETESEQVTAVMGYAAVTRRNKFTRHNFRGFGK